MPLAEGQMQIRDLVMGPGTEYVLLAEVNPWNRRVRADQGGARAWAHGSWSGAEWADEMVVPIPVRVEAGDGTHGGWLSAHQQLAAAFAPAATGSPPAGSTVTNTWQIYPQQANFGPRELDLVMAQQEARQRAGRPR